MKILEIPSLELFNNDWELLQKFLSKRNYPPYSLGGMVELGNMTISSLNNLVAVRGHLSLINTKIDSLGCLKSIEGNLNLQGSTINDIGDLKYVGENLFLDHLSPLFKVMMRNKVSLGGVVFYHHMFDFFGLSYS